MNFLNSAIEWEKANPRTFSFIAGVLTTVLVKFLL